MPNMTMLHGSNLPLLKVLAGPFITLQQAFTVCEDCWTWTTLNGDVYEDVVMLELTQDEVTIEHKYGVSTIARTELSRHIQQNLIDHSEMAEPNDFSAGSRNDYADAHAMVHADGFSHAA